jgi:hypothetical protein
MIVSPSNFALYIIGILILMMAFTYFAAQLDVSSGLIEIVDLALLISGIAAGIILIRHKKP